MGKRRLTGMDVGRRRSDSPDVERAKEAATGRQEEPTKRLNVNVPESLYEEFRRQCESEGRSMTWVVTQFLEDYVSTDE